MERQLRSDRTGRASGGLSARRSFLREAAPLVAVVAAAAALAAIVVLGIDILLAAFAGVLLAIFLRALTELVERLTGIPDGWAFGLVLLASVALLGGAGWLLAPPLSEQAEALGRQLPQVMGEVERFLRQTGWGTWLLERGRSGSGDVAAEDIGGLFASLSNVSSYLLTTLFVALFAAANPRIYRDGVVQLAPLGQRARVREVLDEVGHTLRRWLVGQAVAMALIGASTTLVLWLFDVPLALLVGAIVGLLGFVPYLGPILGLLPVVLVAAPEGATTLAWVLLTYTGVQVVEGYVATPLIHHQTVYLPPALTLVVQMLLGAVLGVMGIVLATPLAAVLAVLARFYRRDVLGDPAAAHERGEPPAADAS